jgi:N-methylhydantoinase B
MDRYTTEQTEARREELEGQRDGELPQFDYEPLPPLEEQRRLIAETRRKFNESLSHELGGMDGSRG